MAAKNLKRSIRSAQLKRHRRNPYLKIRKYETLHDLNRGFQIAARTLDRLERFAPVQRDKLRAYRQMSEEVRALANMTMLETLHKAEMRDAGRFGKLRLKWEQRPFPKMPKTKPAAAAKPGR
jgi:hypothetical protein